MVLESRKSKVLVSADLLLGEVSLLGLQMVTFSLCPYMEVRGSFNVYFSFCKGTNAVMTSSKPDYLPNVPPRNTYHIGS